MEVNENVEFVDSNILKECWLGNNDSRNRGDGGSKGILTCPL